MFVPKRSSQILCTTYAMTKHLLLIITTLLLAVTTTANTVTTNKSCYSANENFVVSFTDTSPQSGDTVVIALASTTQALLSQATCSGLVCILSLPTSGTITFTEHQSAGSYQALLRRSSSSGTVLATSATFRLVASGQSCSTSPPTPSPTLKATPPPTPSQTLKPTLLPTLPPSTPATINDLANQVLTQARAAIVSLVQANARLTPEFIRMGFHDCINVCDGKKPKIAFHNSFFLV
jgi:hypothetical protein